MMAMSVMEVQCRVGLRHSWVAGRRKGRKAGVWWLATRISWIGLVGIVRVSFRLSSVLGLVFEWSFLVDLVFEGLFLDGLVFQGYPWIVLYNTSTGMIVLGYG
jgi:hypothetical protein